MGVAGATCEVSLKSKVLFGQYTKPSRAHEVIEKRDLFNEEVNKDESILLNKSINIPFGHLQKWMLFACVTKDSLTLT